MKQSPNLILAEIARQRDSRMFSRLLGTGPLTRRLDRIGARLNRCWSSRVNQK